MFLSVGLVVLRGSPGKRARPHGGSDRPHLTEHCGCSCEEARAVLQLDSGVPGGHVPRADPPGSLASALTSTVADSRRDFRALRELMVRDGCPCSRRVHRLWGCS